MKKEELNEEILAVSDDERVEKEEGMNHDDESK